MGAFGMKTVLSSKLYFSYNQFMVYDRDVALPGCAWTPEHSAQGFARRESVVNFNTILEYGHAEVIVTLGAYEPRPRHERVIAVPFLATSGRIIVEGPEETNVERGFNLAPGNYRLIAAQSATDDADEEIDLFFEALVKPLERSAILLADEGLDPRTPLIETAAIAGEG